jgi:hypothetical protein
MRKPRPANPTRERYIGSGLITPDPIRSAPPLSADALADLGFHAAAKAARATPIWSRAR